MTPADVREVVARAIERAVSADWNGRVNIGPAPDAVLAALQGIGWGPVTDVTDAARAYVNAREAWERGDDNKDDWMTVQGRAIATEETYVRLAAALRACQAGARE
jgi:hypothetical protein